MRRIVLVAGLVPALACGEPRDAPRSAAGPLATRTAVVPVRPESATAAFPAPEFPLAGACLAGDPERADAWRLIGLDTVGGRTLVPIAGLDSRDSARLVTRLTRAADALPNDTSIADFRGLPVLIRAAWRLVIAPGDTVFLATAVRRLPIESAPLEEQTAFIAHPVTLPALRDPLRVEWAARMVGQEGTVASREPVKAWSDPSGIAILFARDDDGVPRAELLTRSTEAWRLSWEGPMRVCGSAP